MTSPDPRTPQPPRRTGAVRSDEPHRRKRGGFLWLLLGLLALLLLLGLAVAIYFLLRGDDDTDSAAASPPPASAPASPVAPSAGAAATPPSAAPGGAGAGGTGSAGAAGAGAAAGAAAGGLVGGSVTTAVPAAQVQDGAALATPGTVGTVLFGVDSADLTDSGQQVMADAVQRIRSSGARSVAVTGYTDVVGGQPINSSLSQQRADTVASRLRQELGAQVNVTTAARGQEDPVVPNDTDAHRQLNRRATISVR